MTWSDILKNQKLGTKQTLTTNLRKVPKHEDDHCCIEAKKYLKFFIIGWRENDWNKPYKVISIINGKRVEREEYYTDEEKVQYKSQTVSQADEDRYMSLPCDEFKKLVTEKCSGGHPEVGAGVDWCAVKLFLDDCEEGYRGGARQWHEKDNWLWGDEIETSEIWGRI